MKTLFLFSISFLISTLLIDNIQAKHIISSTHFYNFNKESNPTLFLQSQSTPKKKSSKKKPKPSYFDKMGWALRKGTWGISTLFSGKRATNTDVDLIFAGVDELLQKSFGVSGSISYFTKENFSVGFSGSYLQSEYSLKANILQNFLSRDIQNNTRRYSINPFIKNYIPLSYRNIIYITNQTELNYQQEQGIYTTLVNKEAGASIPIPGLPPPQQVLERKDSRILNLGLRIRPGVLIFFAPRFAFESNISIFGFNYKIEKLTYVYPNGKPDAGNIKDDVTNRSTTFDFKLDFLNFGFGFAYFL